MKALTYHFSYPRFAAGKMFGGLSRGGPLVYENVPDARLFGDDWVIVETRYCGICGSDVKQAYLEGAFDNPMTAVISFPHVLGHEVAGTVVEAGKDVRHVKKGDRVACYPWITCAVRGLPPCTACAAGDLALCQNFTGGRFSAGIHHGTCRDLSGGFATHMPAHESACFPIPNDVTFEEAALADPFSVCLHAVHKAPPRRGETVVVVGCGALGMLLIHFVSRFYPGVTIWGVDVLSSQREKALAIGATDFFSLPPRELIATIGERTETALLRPMGGLPWLHGGVDRVYDTVATAGTLEVGVRILRPHGTLVMVGVATPARFEWTPIYFKELAILGASGYGIETVDSARDHAFRLYLDLASRRRVEPGPLVTHTMPMQDFRQGFRTAREKATYRSIKVLLEPSPSSVPRRGDALA